MAVSVVVHSTGMLFRVEARTPPIQYVEGFCGMSEYKGVTGKDHTYHVVHPVTPEDRQHGVRTDYSVEQGEHDEEEWQDVADDGEGWGKGTDPLTPATYEQPEEHCHEEDVAGCRAVGG